MMLPIFILSISLTFANADIKSTDIINSVFDICDQKDTEDGLTFTEVQESTCMDHLKATFGILSGNIAHDFAFIDQNGDGTLSKQEIFNGLQTLGIDRSPESSSPKVPWDVVNSLIFALQKNKWEVVYSHGYNESQMEEIILKATDLRDNQLDPFKWENPKPTDFVMGLILFLENSYGQRASCLMDKLNRAACALRAGYHFRFQLQDDNYWVRCWGLYCS